MAKETKQRQSRLVNLGGAMALGLATLVGFGGCTSRPVEREVERSSVMEGYKEEKDIHGNFIWYDREGNAYWQGRRLIGYNKEGTPLTEGTDVVIKGRAKVKRAGVRGWRLDIYGNSIWYDREGNAYYQGRKVVDYVDGIPVVECPGSGIGLKEHGDIRDMLFDFFTK